jgi:hypothetical protein
LDQLGIDISVGQVSRILTEEKDAFHQEKAEPLPAGLAVSTTPSKVVILLISYCHFGG